MDYAGIIINLYTEGLIMKSFDKFHLAMVEIQDRVGISSMLAMHLPWEYILEAAAKIKRVPLRRV